MLIRGRINKRKIEIGWIGVKEQNSDVRLLKRPWSGVQERRQGSSCSWRVARKSLDAVSIVETPYLPSLRQRYLFIGVQDYSHIRRLLRIWNLTLLGVQELDFDDLGGDY